ncbi:MAG: radical SAM protein [Alistipes sp.]|nr:radical SAM protein [Alistipes sp.]
MTALFEDIIFGPVRSRRLGISLGVNLPPAHSKICSFDCIYCECGFNGEHAGDRRFADRGRVSLLLEGKLREMAGAGALPDVITFAGNGEPTLHPQFGEIVGDVLALRDRYCPAARVSVLSNATQIHREDVRRALLRVDNNILKLDSAFDDTVRLIDRPQGAYSVRRIVELMKLFGGRMILQTMFLRGWIDGARVDNTTAVEVGAWLEIVRELKPAGVMVYSLDRDTPCKTLEKVSHEELEAIAARVREAGIECSAT